MVVYSGKIKDRAHCLKIILQENGKQRKVDRGGWRLPVVIDRCLKQRSHTTIKMLILAKFGSTGIDLNLFPA
jgi:hypothetical protein